MMKATSCLIRRGNIRTDRAEVGIWQPFLLFVFFLAGSVIGSIVGAGQTDVSAAEHVFLEDGSIYGTNSIFELLFFCSKYHLLVLLLGTSLLGVVFIPAALSLRGFVLSCTAASIIASYPNNGVLLVAAVLALPSLLTVPSLFVLGINCFRFSSRLLSLYGRKSPPPSIDMGADFLCCVVALMFSAAIEHFIVPLLVGLIM